MLILACGSELADSISIQVRDALPDWMVGELREGGGGGPGVRNDVGSGRRRTSSESHGGRSNRAMDNGFGVGGQDK